MTEMDQSAWEHLFEQSRQLAPTIVELATLDFWGISTENAPVGQYPPGMGTGGALRGSIQYEVHEGQGIVGTNLEYAPYVHNGFPAHDIEAKSAHALGPMAISSYLGVKIGGFVGKTSMGKNRLASSDVQFFKKVHHPGYAGNPFFEKSIPIVEGRQDDYMQSAMERLGLND